MRRLASIAILAIFATMYFAERAPGRSAHEVADWLCAKIFEGGDVTLAFAPDGFFGMRIAPQGKSVQNITGLWRLAPDGIELELRILQDSRIRLSVGKGALYGIMGNGSHITLLPMQKDKATFRITGMLRKAGKNAILTDASSGRDFVIDDPGDAADGKFAIAEIEMSRGEVSDCRLIRHSRAVPRFYDPGMKGSGDFSEDVSGRFWLLPGRLWKEGAALHFSRPEKGRDESVLNGDYEVSGPGLRLEGRYSLSGEKLILTPNGRSMSNLELIGAGELGNAVSGEFTWHVSAGGLELVSVRGRLVLQAP